MSINPISVFVNDFRKKLQMKIAVWKMCKYVFSKKLTEKACFFTRRA